MMIRVEHQKLFIKKIDELLPRIIEDLINNLC